MTGLCRPIPLPLTPAQAFAAWPSTYPLAALWSSGDSSHARWTIFACPSKTATHNPATAAETVALLVLPATVWPAPDAPPFQGGIIAALSYNLGPILEPAATRCPAPPDPAHPLLELHTCDNALIFDHQTNQWWSIGDPPPLQEQATPTFHAGPLHHTPSADYQSGVSRILDYIRAGDIYQANLAHHLTAPFRGCPRSFFLSLAKAARPWFGAYLESPTRTIASASPELFLSFAPTTRRLTTRPMKGTRPARQSDELRSSEKDAAELNMITDLMRNDLGRVCELGSVSVEHQRSIEHHAVAPGTATTADGQLAQATSTISGSLRAGLTFPDALASAFPGGSITGCPKIRAMQIIEELEPTPRHAYCGSIGYISRSGHAAFNIAIRTATISGGTLTYPVGAGIVIDSNPASEWQETLDKAGVVRRALGMTRISADIIDAYVFRRTPRPHFLQLLRADEPMVNTWHPVIGHALPSEIAITCILRELREETGLTPPHIRGLWSLEEVHPYYFASEDVVILSPGFAVEVAADWVPTLNHEHTAHRWTTTVEDFMWPSQRAAVIEVLNKLIPNTSEGHYERIDPTA